MIHTELYAISAGRAQQEDPVEALEKEEAAAFAVQEREEWLHHQVSQAFFKGLEDKAKEYTDRAMEQSTPFGDQKLCTYFLALAAILRKVVTYARTGKYSE